MKRIGLGAMMAAMLLAGAPAAHAAEPSGPDPSRFGGEQVDPKRFGNPAAPTDSIGPSPTIQILKPKNVTPGPSGEAAPEPVDPKRFGGRPPDEAYGAFQRGFYQTAYNLALPRAEKGDAAAQALIADLLTRGLGVKQDEKAAAQWYAKAAAQGVPEAQFQTALIQLDGKLAPKDEKAAMALMRKAADAGNPLAQFNLAQLYVRADPSLAGFKNAYPYFEKAAAAGLADAQYAMAQIYETGADGQAPDLAKARGYLLQAAKQGYDTAALDLGTWMVEGKGGARSAQSEREGFAWLKRTAEGGNVAAMNRLAKLYVQGIGAEPNPVDAAAWYMLAHKAGLVDYAMSDYLDGLTDEQLKQATERSTKLR